MAGHGTRQHKKSKQLRGQIQLLLECLVWNVPEYLPTYSLSWHTNYSLLSKHATPGQHRERHGTRVCWCIVPNWPVIKNWPRYIQHRDNPITDNWESNYCLYFGEMHGKRRVWPLPWQHQCRLASAPGASVFPRGILNNLPFMGQWWGESHQY